MGPEMRRTSPCPVSRRSGKWAKRPACETVAMPEALLVLCTGPDEALADTIARALVEERLAACVNRLPGVVSTYRWQGAVQTDAELLLLVKTTAARFEAVRDRIVALHRYELPEVVAVTIASGLDRYLGWIASETTPSA